LSLVKRGFIQEPEVFLDERLANQRKTTLMGELNPDYDEVALFEKQIQL